MDNIALVAGPDSREQLFKHMVGLVLIQVPWLPLHHEFVKVAPRDVWRDHDDLIFPHDSLGERQHIRLAHQLVVDVDFTLHVHHQIFLDNLLRTHALENHDFFGLMVPSYGDNADHPTPDQSADLILANLGIQDSLFSLLDFFSIAISLLLVSLVEHHSSHRIPPVFLVEDFFFLGDPLNTVIVSTLRLREWLVIGPGIPPRRSVEHCAIPSQDIDPLELQAGVCFPTHSSGMANTTPGKGDIDGGCLGASL